MTPLLWIVFAVLVWNVLLTLIPVTVMIAKDFQFAASSRDGDGPEMPLWAQRAKRSSENMKENLPLFFGFAVLVHLVNPSSAQALLGAQIFFGARVLHAVVYMAGVPHVRTLLWVTSLVGAGMMASALF